MSKNVAKNNRSTLRNLKNKSTSSVQKLSSGKSVELRIYSGARTQHRKRILEFLSIRITNFSVTNMYVPYRYVRFIEFYTLIGSIKLDDALLVVRNLKFQYKANDAKKVINYNSSISSNYWNRGLLFKKNRILQFIMYSKRICRF